MRMYPEKFHPKRLGKPTRRAELRIYQALARSLLPGFAYYEWRRDFDDHELDFAVWIRDHGRAAMQVKGGHYQMVNCNWKLHTQGRIESITSCPIDEAYSGALDLHDDIVDKLTPSYNPFVVPVLAFPDMDPNEAIAKFARRKRVCLIWRSDDPVARLTEILRAQPVRNHLSAECIIREVYAVTDELLDLDQMDDTAATGVSRPKIAADCPESEPAAPEKTVLINLGNVGLIGARARDIQVHTKVRR